VRAIISAATAVTFFPLLAEAEDTSFFFDVAMSSALLDRGEQIGGQTAEFYAGAEVDAGSALLYTTVYRLLPVGSDRNDYDNETDYTIGAIWEGRGYVADVSANWLTYPGEQAKETLELAATLTLDLPLEPGVAAYRDAHTDDWGMEAFGGPRWERGAWTFYALGRMGFVNIGDGSASRSYGGIETGAIRALSDTVAMGFVVRTEVADEEGFDVRTGADGVATGRNTGTALVVSLSHAH
jgi:hypothetical protein